MIAISIGAFAIIASQLGLIFYLIRRADKGHTATHKIYDENFELKQSIQNFQSAIAERDRTMEALHERTERLQSMQQITERQRDELLAAISDADSGELAARMRRELQKLQDLGKKPEADPHPDAGDFSVVSKKAVLGPLPYPPLHRVAKPKS